MIGIWFRVLVILTWIEYLLLLRLNDWDWLINLS